MVISGLRPGEHFCRSAGTLKNFFLVWPIIIQCLVRFKHHLLSLSTFLLLSEFASCIIFLSIFHYQFFYAIQKQPFSKLGGCTGLSHQQARIFRSHTNFYKHTSFINNIVTDEILAEFDNSSSAEANAREIERFIDEKFGEMMAADTEKKIVSLSRNMTKHVKRILKKWTLKLVTEIAAWLKYGWKLYR